MTTIRTERLILRPFVPEDLPAYAAIRRTPGVLRYLPKPAEPIDNDTRSARAIETFRETWAENGYGPWAVLRGDMLIGHAGLRWVPEEEVTEVLYLLDPAHHGQGFATEAARAALHLGFGTLGLDRIVAWAMPENTASLAVMERLGMTRAAGTVTVFGVEAVECHMSAARWAEQEGATQ